MIARLSGTITYLGADYVILDVSGVGYKVHVPRSVLDRATQASSLELWTHLASRENTTELYGFAHKEELDFFEMLIAISGVGPKSALAVLSLAPLATLTRAIAAGDTSYLTKVSGIGKKMAGKIVFELKDTFAEGEHADISGLREESEALEALEALGYSTRDAREALGKVEEDAEGTNERIKEALKYLGT